MPKEDRPVVATREMARRKRRRRALGVLAVGILAVGATGYGAWRYIDQQEYLLDERCELKVGEEQYQLEPGQAANAALIAAIAVDRGLPREAAAHAIAISLQESDLTVTEASDEHDGRELFARGGPSWDSGTDVEQVATSVDEFYDVLEESSGREDPEEQWSTDLTVEEAAEVLGRPHDISFYEQHEGIGRAFSGPLTGSQPVGMTCHLSQLEAPAPDPEGMSEELAALLGTSLGLPAPEEENSEAEDEADEDAEPAAPDYGEVITVNGSGQDAEIIIEVPSEAGAEDGPDYDYLWMIAHWSVATADQYGVQSVHAGPFQWDRSSGSWSRVEEVNDEAITVGFSSSDDE